MIIEYEGDSIDVCTKEIDVMDVLRVSNGLEEDFVSYVIRRVRLCSKPLGFEPRKLSASLSPGANM
jgi:hypothetical protein